MAQLEPGLAQPVEDVLGIFQKDLAGPGQPDAPRRPDQECCIELLFQAVQLGSQRRLGHVHGVGRLRDTAELADPDKAFQVADAHAVSSPARFCALPRSVKHFRYGSRENLYWTGEGRSVSLGMRQAEELP